ncbi:MAG TPA: DUF2806 domain-containing protein [Xanthobacteraceae bacterium]|nr:DUF2806 domain-containing protein [Xanthobacteraceae bacterium]
MSNGLPVLPEGFGRAAEKLVDTVRHVIDVVVGPTRMRARAQAQADSAVILAEGRAQVQEIEARAVERLRRREGRRQRNIEAITTKALAALPPPGQISEQPVSEDWTSRFFEECQDISDEQMQLIWARLMAGEVARPGSFSPRTLGVVRDLTKEDANLFSKVCEFAWSVPTLGTVPVIHTIEAPNAIEVQYGELMHLAFMGLIELNSVGTFCTIKPTREISPSYFGKVHQLMFGDGTEQILDVGHVVFTVAGSELEKISGAIGSAEYQRVALEGWFEAGWRAQGAVTPPPSA